MSERPTPVAVPVFLLAALAWCLGSALQLQQSQVLVGRSLHTVLAASAVAAMLVWWWLRQMRAGWLVALGALLWVAALAGIAFAVVSARADMRLAERLAPALEGKDLRVTGVVASMPQPFAGAFAGGQRFRFEPDAGQPDLSISLPPALWVSWYAGLANGELNGVPALKVGERWVLTLRLKRPHGSANPHGFDYELWLFEQGLGATGYVRAAPAAQRVGSALEGWDGLARPRLWVERARQATRDALQTAVTDERAAGVLAALVVGDQRAIDRAEWDLFRATGVAHLMSISGLHVTMFAWGAALVVGWMWRRSARLCLLWPAPHAARMGGFALALAYAVFSGFGVPAQRTVWMVGTVTVIALLGLRWSAWRVLLASGAVVVVVDPWALLQPGFWLSFVAVAMLFASGPACGSAVVAAPWWKRMAREQWVATLALAPLSLLFFQQASLVGLVANAMAIPLVTLLITPLALLGVVVPIAWALASALTQALLWILQWLASVGPTAFTLPAMGLLPTLLGMAAVGLLVIPLPWAARLLALPLGLPLLMPAVAPGAWAATVRPPWGQFELLAADVGQGTAVVIRTTHQTWLYDTGPRYSAEADAGDRVLVPLLRAMGERRLDHLVVSHRDTDHAGGAASVLKVYPDTRVLTSVADTEALAWGARHVQRCEAGQGWVVDGVRFELLHPSTADYRQANAKPNALSCVLRVSAALGASALLTGDIERAQEQRLAGERTDALRSDVLIVPHHGSKTSSTEALLTAVRPKTAVVQAGYRNRFGHPAAEVVARYEEAGIQLIQSPSCGAWRWRSDQVPAKGQCWRLEAARYWGLPARR